MELELISDNITDYLKAVPPIVVFDSPLIQKTIQFITSQTDSKREQAKISFEIARDKIGHSFDTKKEKVTINAEDVLKAKDGICFAKAHLLATLLRGIKIPSGFCYQRVLRNPKDTNSGHALHGLNALYLEDTGWFRIDPRGNKPGVNAQFSIQEEQLAYPIRPELGEIDYPYILPEPFPAVISAMKDSGNSKELFFKRPDSLT